MEYYKSEIKTGLLAVTCVIILIFTTFYVGGTNLWGTTYCLEVAYKNVGGLDLDAPVHFAGLEVGKVKLIRVIPQDIKTKFPDCSILVDIELDKLVEVKKDSKLLIKTMGFMGLKYIDITPGSQESELVSPDSLVKGDIPQDMNEVMESVGEIVDTIKPRTNSIVTGIDNIVGEKGNLYILIDSVKEIIQANKGDINKLIANLASASEHFKLFAEDIKNHPWKLLIKTKEKPKEKEKQAETIKPLEQKSFGVRSKTR